MGFLDRLFGSDEPQARTREPVPAADTVDRRAIERYRYLLRTAPPETIEQVHAEAFARLTDSQRALIYEELSRGAGTGERPLSSEPATLARAATRAELRSPGSLERSLSGSTAGVTPGGPSFGSMLASSMLGTVAGYVIGSALVSAFLPWDAAYDPAASDTGASDAGADASADADFGSADFGSADFGDFGF
ncbi:hypothetical protein [Protaetiibacter intestinalis]|uniref:DUF2076 domain-containing protein n=1 Tax=Protaetiibacter intestinalis TaxID=2419774 RepID=A0A387B8I6_9MICO|nr:hypothetical protein [Protaetiibacter intestinalis]AYF98667.1 hypothetical protein D7I47_10625 [Protaetiibacter intestinalis]